ncbi:MAG TPA: sensor histidine kinase [Candidatus Dormibacteraeota bacterium]|nr:sensor histidine kinase [Candidatus Dormibacteraeota bacterium]
MEAQQTAWLSVKQRRLAMLVMAALLLMELWLSEIRELVPLHAMVMSALTLSLIALSLFERLGRPILRVGAMAVATVGLTLLSHNEVASWTPVGAYIVILDATQQFPLCTAAALTGAMACVWVLAAARVPGGPVWVDIAFNLGFFFFAFVVLYGVRRLRDEQRRVGLLLDELRASRERELEAAKVQERTRLARDIHDVLAHSLTALIVQLDGARMLLDRERASPEARESLQRARHLAQDGLDETRRAVGALRGDRVPGAEMLPSLVRDFERDSGLHCTYAVEGEPLPLSSAAQLALYRTAQEALTNVRKHAPGNDVRVQLRYRDGGVELIVDDAGTAPPAPTNGAGGYGLEGMRERAELLGGNLEAGRHDGGFRVRLWLPA